MTKIDQDIPKEKKGNKDDMPGQQANKRTEVETQQVVGCKRRVLVGYENEKTFATFTTTKFRYFERNKFIKEYKHIKDNYSWNDENKGELVYSEPAESKHSSKIYDL